VKISIVTVTYNSISTIENCLSSIIEQTFKDIDYVVVDGSSTDGTLDLLKKNSKYISTLISQPDNGIYHAMNKGISSAKGDIIGFLNSDDFYVNDQIIDRVAKVFSEDPSIEACYADLIYVNQKDTSEVIRYWKSNKFKSGAFIKGWSPPHPKLFVRKNIICPNYMYNEKLKISSDYQMILKLFSQKNFNAIYIDKYLVRMRVGGISNKSLGNIILKTYEDFISLKVLKLTINKRISCLIKKNLSKLNQFTFT
jgi:glycosyltransferase involved in cell wall biosynthesis